MVIMGYFIFLAVLVLPLISSTILCKRAYQHFKKRKTMWPIAGAGLVFILAYVGTFVVIILALDIIYPFRR